MDELLSKAQEGRIASRALARATSEQKNAALDAIAASLLAQRTQILEANAADCAAAEQQGMAPAMLDRLRLTDKRLEAMAHDVRAVIALPDPVGERYDHVVRPNGLRIHKQRTPLGVVGVVYEARPNVTSDVAALCIKTGNAVILRGGKESLRANIAIVAAISEGLRAGGLPLDAVQIITSTDRQLVARLLKLRQYIDVIIPRGGAGLIQFVAENATIPVIETGAGVCHTYVDKAADAQMAASIVYNAKVRRPTICNAMDTLLIHRSIAGSALPLIASRLAQANVELRCDADALAIIPQLGRPASEDDWGKEFLALVAAVKVVSDIDDALEHIVRYGSGHSEAIVTADEATAQRFLNEVDAAAVYWNASTQFTDGGEFGLGAEIGISTQKLHARGPMALRELTTYKWVVEGAGQVRPT